MSTFQKVAENASKKVGLSLEKICDMSPEDIREYLVRKQEKKFKISSFFPAIGRVNILRDNIKTSEQINKEIDVIL